MLWMAAAYVGLLRTVTARGKLHCLAHVKVLAASAAAKRDAVCRTPRIGVYVKFATAAAVSASVVRLFTHCYPPLTRRC